MVTFFGLEVARLLHAEPLLTLLVAGFITQNVSRRGRGRVLREAMERSAAPVFVVFFALAGAKLDLSEVVRLWTLVLPIVLVRAGGLWIGCRVGGRWAGLAPSETRYYWLGLVAQAGVAIGLVDVASAVYPAAGGDMRTILLAVIAVDQTVGPILFRRALQKAGEVGQGGKAGAGLAEREPAPA
jgi:Kef-type K+ transport system membrane component KefB